ncbi:MAG TPA: helix-turn-helix domain-containing protein [Candidatus Dormibacteraeota bacterium]|nr:helix-turn-helix domain-containing protein [Candidatus Dormibacteraeota bacterium]
MDIGAKLKEAREAKNISLDTLQETTKIQKRYLLAIEQGNLHILPGKFYARAFIKEYATAVGLDPNEILEGHKDEVPESKIENEMPYTRMQRTRQESRASKSPAIFSIMPIIIVILLVIGIILAGVYFYQKAISTDQPDEIEQRDTDEIIRNRDNTDTDNSDDPSSIEAGQDNEDNKNDDNNENDEDTDDEPSETIEPEFTVIETGSGSRPESIVELNLADEKVVITFEPTGTSWLDIKNEQGENLLGVNTTENDPVELDITGEEKVRLNIGNTTFLPVIKVNDVQLEYPVDAMTQYIWIHVNQESE